MDSPLVSLKIFGALALEFVFVLYVYFRYSQPQPAGFITLGSIIEFVQLCQTLIDIPLKWPHLIESLFDFLGHFSVAGFLMALQVHTSCLAGSGYQWKVARNLLVPLTPAGHLLLAHLVGCIFGKSLRLS